MLRWLLILTLLLLAAGLALADERAVVRVISHGASATVIATQPGRSWILGCAHAYQGNDRHKRNVLDLPPHPPTQGQGGTRLLAVDYQLDLSLLELGVGPLPVLPVAPAGHRISGPCVSVGYDRMAWPATRARADVIGTDARQTWTQQMPWHGRSGGALYDPAGPHQVGVVGGYAGPPGGQMRGFYASHSAILTFLRRQGWSVGRAAEEGPRLEVPPPNAWSDRACPPGAPT